MGEATERIGLYGGTFDPIHNGHLQLAEELMRRYNLDRVLFCPAFISPHKQDSLPLPPEHRLRMVELAVGDIEGFEVLDYEVNRGGPSYTVETIEMLRREHPLATLFLLLGNDSIPSFHRWYRVEEIVDLATVVVGRRVVPDPPVSVDASPKVRRAVESGLTETPVFEVSATELRRRLRGGLDCEGLIPTKVLDYISKNRLYS